MSGLLAVAAIDGLDAMCAAALQVGRPSRRPRLPGRLLRRLPGGAKSGADGRAAAIAGHPGPVRHRAGDCRRAPGGGPPQVRAVLRRMSGVDAVIDRLVAAGAQVRYQRMRDAVCELEALAVFEGRYGGRLGIGRADQRVSVQRRHRGRADGGRDRSGTGTSGWGRDPAAHLPRAARWQRYGRRAVSDLHRACAATSPGDRCGCGRGPAECRW